MAVRGVLGSGHQVHAARAAYEVAALNRKSVSRTTSTPTPSSTSTSVNISERAELFGKLRTLHDTQPKEFKRVVSEMAESARSQAASSDSKKRELSMVADRFQQAASEGNITPLVPPIEIARAGRAAFPQAPDVMNANSDALRQLFRGFVTKVNAVLDAGANNQARARR